MPGANSSGCVFRVVFLAEQRNKKQRSKAFQTVRLWKQEHRARLDIPGENEKTAISRGFEKCATDGT